MQLIVLHCAVREAHGGRVVPSNHLLYDSIHVGKRGAVTEVGKTIRAHDGVELDMRFPEHFRIEREREERCRECRKRLSMCSDTSVWSQNC